MCEIMLWVGELKSVKIFQLQKKMNRLITGVHNMNIVGIYLANFTY